MTCVGCMGDCAILKLQAYHASLTPAAMSTSDPLRPRSDAEPALNLPGVARLMATGLGMIVILIGLWAVLKVFLAILVLFTTPDKMAAGLAAWSQALANVEV